MGSFLETILSVPYGKTYLFSVGQAGFIIRAASGQLLGIDLYLSDCVERTEGHIGFKRMLPKILNPNEIAFDALVATHPHLDHFDMDSIPEMMCNGHTKLYCSTDCRKLVAATQMEYFEKNIIYVAPGKEYIQGDFKLFFVNCDHGTGAPDAVGVVVEVDGKRIYEAGDTCLRLDRVDEMEKHGKLDVLIAPINGAYGNLDSADCTKLATALQPVVTVPCHYGMFAAHGGNPGEFLALMNEAGNGVFIMAQGERLEL